MGCGVTAKDFSEDRHGKTEIAEIHRPPDRILRLSELKNQQARPTPGDPVHFSETCFPIWQVSQSIADGHNIKGAGWERKVLRISLLKIHLDGLPLPGAQSRHGKHGIAEINSGDVSARFREGKGEVARSTTNVESNIVWRHLGKVHQFLLPPPVQSKALQVID